MLESFRCTEKQVEIMKVIFAATDKGETLTMTDLKARLSYGDKITFVAIWYSVKYLAGHGLIVKERRGRNAYILPTVLGYKVMRS